MTDTTSRTRIRFEAFREVAAAIEAHREAWASTNPHHAFGEGLQTAQIIANDHAYAEQVLLDRGQEVTR